MNKVLYIGQYTDGTTSKMRAETLNQLIAPTSFEVIDIHKPFFSSNRIVRSIGFRFKKGPLITQVNKFILDKLSDDYDLIWVDKAIFVTEKTTRILRKKAKLLVHFSPDPAFTYHRSMHFNESLEHYDFVITTKSFEKDYYTKYLSEDKLILATQGYDKNIHIPYHSLEAKKPGVVFIGHFETYRASILQVLTDEGIEVTIAGIKWDKFVQKNKRKSNLSYLGRSISGKDYAFTISSYMYSIGFLSKWIPELHTTRTFEIPACGTILITERNKETEMYFTSDEVIFYRDAHDIVEQIKKMDSNPHNTKNLREKTLRKMANQEFEYGYIMKQLLFKMDIQTLNKDESNTNKFN
jgi:spore maturation protein CgeB